MSVHTSYHISGVGHGSQLDACAAPRHVQHCAKLPWQWVHLSLFSKGGLSVLCTHLNMSAWHAIDNVTGMCKYAAISILRPGRSAVASCSYDLCPLPFLNVNKGVAGQLRPFSESLHLPSCPSSTMSSVHEEDFGQIVNAPNAATGRPSSARLMKPTPVTVSGISFVSTLWLIFTLLVLCGLVVVAAFPRWIHNDVNTPEKRRELDNLVHEVNFGLYHFCYELAVSLDQSTNNATFEECTTYLQFSPRASLGDTPTNLLEAELKDIAFLFSASIVYAFAFLMLLLSLVLGIVAYFKPKVLGNSMFAVAFVFQVVGGERSVISPILSSSSSLFLSISHILSSLTPLSITVPLFLFLPLTRDVCSVQIGS